MRYQALSSESFNSKTPSPMDCIGLTSNLGGRPCCISRNEIPKSKRIDFGHDFRMFHESPSHDIVATRGFSPCATFSIYRKFSIIATSLLRSSGKIGRPSSALEPFPLALLLPQLAHDIDRIRPAAIRRCHARAQAVEQFRQRRFVERFEIDDLELLQQPRPRLHACPSASTTHTDGRAEQVMSQTPSDGLRTNTRRQVLPVRLQVNVNRLVAAADLDHLAVERAWLLHGTQLRSEEHTL